MFTWICPKCGSDVPPSFTDCPNCAAKAAAQPAEPVSTPESHVGIPAPPVAAPARPDPPTHPPVTHETPQPRRALSPVVVAAGSGIVMAALLAVLYLWVLPSRSIATKAPVTELQGPGVAGGSSQHPLAKHLEVSGLRITPGADGTAKVRYMVVNHSAADLPELKMEIAVRAGSGAAVLEFPADVPSIGPYEARELGSTVKTNLKPYELPDWQTVRADFRLLGEP
ncbi:MAG TPA: zinc ribbon domain-containing protein [Bryobacteraceae bacterium]|nr:zinc ribbon domain-containing protein [Bryobacteraceae bacterium]